MYNLPLGEWVCMYQPGTLWTGMAVSCQLSALVPATALQHTRLDQSHSRYVHPTWLLWICKNKWKENHETGTSSLGKTKGHNRSWLKDQLAMCTSSSIEPFWPYVKHITLHHIFFLDKTYMRRLSAVESGSILTFVHKWRGVWCPDRGWALPPTVSLGRGVSLHSPYLSLHLQPDPHSLESNIRHPTQRVIISFGSTTRSVCFKLLYMCWHLCT